MVVYLTKEALNESVSGEDVSKAIDNKAGVLITYKGYDNKHEGVRYIEPYAYGVTSKNNPAIRAYQYYGDTKTGVPQWKVLRLDRIESWKPTGQTFDLEPKARGWAAQAFNGNDKMLPTIFKVVDLGEEPVTDLEMLRNRTAQIKQSKPVNISQLNQKTATQPKLNPQDKKQNGPIGNNTPENGIENPEFNNKKETPTPLNTDGTPKTNTNQAPIRQEPKHEGPIVGDATNPSENKAEDLMSNQQFVDMLKRNRETNTGGSENKNLQKEKF